VGLFRDPVSAIERSTVCLEIEPARESSKQMTMFTGLVSGRDESLSPAFNEGSPRRPLPAAPFPSCLASL
jgi:hypothetical protein